MLSKEQEKAAVKVQVIYWLTSMLFASGLALFAKLVWTANFPILIMLPLLMIGFALGGITHFRKTLAEAGSAESENQSE